MAAKGKKYTLKAQSGDGPKICAFFSLPQGCRNAAKCPFIHDPNAAAPGEHQPAAAPPATPAALTKNIKAMKQVKGTNEGKGREPLLAIMAGRRRDAWGLMAGTHTT